MNFDAIKLILNDQVVYYTDELNNADVYVEYQKSNGALCFEPINSPHFDAFVCFQYQQLSEEDERPDFKRYLAMKKAAAIYLQDHCVPIHRRITGSLSEGITYALSNDKRQYVTVSPTACNLHDVSDHKFLTGPMDAPQVVPKKGGDYLTLILPKINMAKDDALLYAVYLIHAFSRDSSHFAAIISSSKGTGKSTLTKMSTELIAPTTSGVTLQPTTEDDLKTLLAGSYVAAFDNTAPFTTGFSNILCAAITGANAAKRKLYTNSDQVVLYLHNLVLINGINIVPYKSDLMERCLYFELLPIGSEKRRTDSSIRSEFNRDKPLILGAIFKTLRKAMKILPTIQIEQLHRMADAHQEMMAIALALGIKQEEFQRILDANRQKLEDAYAANSPFVDLVLTFMQSHNSVDYPAAKLYRELEASIVGDKGFFPKSPSMLSRRLNEEKDSLLKNGYHLERYKKEYSNYIKISRIPSSQMTKAQKALAARRENLLEDVSSEN